MLGALFLNCLAQLGFVQQEEGERDAWLAEMDEGTMEEAIGAASTRYVEKRCGQGERSAVCI